MRVDHPAPIALALCSFAAIAVLLLHPRPMVQLEGEIAMLEPADALRMLDDNAEDEGRQRNLAMTHAALALDAGEFATARKVLLSLKSNGEDTAEIEDMLADAGRLSGNPAEELVHLAAAYERDPSITRRERLGLAYRSNRLPEEERRLLESLHSEDLTAYEARRLAQLLRKARDFLALERLYRIRASGDASDAGEAKQLLIQFELETGRPDLAEQQALEWFESSRRDYKILATAIPAFVNWGALDGAMSLALDALDVSPEESYSLIAVFLDGGHQDLAFAFQRDWLADLRGIPIQSWPTLIDVAERTGNLTGLQSALLRTGPSTLPADTQSRALLQFLRYRGTQSLYPFASYLRSDVLSAQPLIGAGWSAGQGNQFEAATYLLQAQSRKMSEWDWQIWQMLADGLRGSPAYQLLLIYALPGTRAETVLSRAFMEKLDVPILPDLGGKGD